MEESSFSHGVTLDALDDAGKLITVENLDSFTVIYERKKGNYHQLPKEWCRFIEKYEHLATKETLYMECTIDDPTITDEDHCMYDLCQTISSEQLVLKKNEHILLQNFQGGKYAAYHFKGFPQFLFMVYQEIFCRWLSRTGNQLDEKRTIFDIIDKETDITIITNLVCERLKQPYLKENPLFRTTIWAHCLNRDVF